MIWKEIEKSRAKLKASICCCLAPPKTSFDHKPRQLRFLEYSGVIQTWHGKDGTPTNFFHEVVRWCNTPMKMAPQKNWGWVITITPIKWALCGPPFITSFWGHPSRLGFNGPTYHWGMFAPQSNPHWKMPWVESMEATNTLLNPKKNHKKRHMPFFCT